MLKFFAENRRLKQQLVTFFFAAADSDRGSQKFHVVFLSPEYIFINTQKILSEKLQQNIEKKDFSDEIGKQNATREKLCCCKERVETHKIDVTKMYLVSCTTKLHNRKRTNRRILKLHFDTFMRNSSLVKMNSFPRLSSFLPHGSHDFPLVFCCCYFCLPSHFYRASNNHNVM